MPGVAMWFLFAASILSTISGMMMLKGSIQAKTSDGLALTMLILNLFASPLWTAYAVANQNYIQMGTSILWTVVLASWWGFWSKDRGRTFWTLPTMIILWTIAITLAAATGAVPFAILGWIAGFVGVISNIPQLVELYKADILGDGFHLKAWAISGASLLSWTLYGLFAWELPIFVPDVVALVVLSLIVTRSVILHRRTNAIPEEAVSISVVETRDNLDDFEHLFRDEKNPNHKDDLVAATMEHYWNARDLASTTEIRKGGSVA